MAQSISTFIFELNLKKLDNGTEIEMIHSKVLENKRIIMIKVERLLLETLKGVFLK